ncbi:MAG TPA: CBS domain-containing protein [Clostridia bacterium]|nr:CBS domain-containing protein [Clostridia bacterium]
MYVSNRMTPNPVTVSSMTSARKALDIMQEKRFSNIPVVDNEGTRIYIVLPDFIGQMAKIANIVKNHGISIDAMSLFDSRVVKAKQMVMKVNAKDAKTLIEDLTHAGIDVRDASNY